MQQEHTEMCSHARPNFCNAMHFNLKGVSVFNNHLLIQSYCRAMRNGE